MVMSAKKVKGDVAGGASKREPLKGKAHGTGIKKAKSPVQGKSFETKKGSTEGRVQFSEDIKQTRYAKAGFKKGQVEEEGKGMSQKGARPAPGRSGGGGDGFASSKPRMDRKAQKELAEKRKMLRRPNFDLEKDALAVWEVIRMHSTKPEQRAAAITTLLGKIKGKLTDLASSPASSRVIQTCLKHCTEAERTAIFEELRPHCLALARNIYGHHLVKKMLDNANKQQRQQIFSTFHSHVVELLRHPSGSAVMEQAYQLANAAEKSEMVAEFYSEEFRLFKGISTGKGRLADVWESSPPSKRGSILQHMAMALQPILEKGIVDHTIIHRAVAEYLSIAGKATVKEVVEQLSGAHLVRMIHTKEGSSVGILCVSLGTAKDRKKIVKGMKGNVMKVACDDYGHLVLLRIFDVVDDTLLVRKVIVSELLKGVEELALHKHGRKVLLHLLAPRVPRYFPASVLSALQPPQLLASASVEDAPAEGAEGEAKEGEGEEEEGEGKKKRKRKKPTKGKAAGVELGESEDENEEGDLGVSKKDPEVRRFELLGPSGLAKALAKVCTESAGKLLRSSTGTDVIYEVASGGPDGVMWRAVPDMVPAVHAAIADEAAQPKDPSAAIGGGGGPAGPRPKKRPREGTGKAAIRGLSTEDAIAVLQGDTPAGDETITEHVLEQWHASRTIRRLVADAPLPPAGVPPFAAVLWAMALRGKCGMWAHGHSAKVVTAMWNCRHDATRTAARGEIQPLLDSGELNDVANLFAETTEEKNPPKTLKPIEVATVQATPKAVKDEERATLLTSSKKQKRDRAK